MLKLLVTQERIERNLTVDEYIGMMDGNLKAMVDALSKFVANESGVGWMEPAEARAQLGKMTMGELNELASTFQKAQEEAVVPNEPAAS